MTDEQINRLVALLPRVANMNCSDLYPYVQFIFHSFDDARDFYEVFRPEEEENQE